MRRFREKCNKWKKSKLKDPMWKQRPVERGLKNLKKIMKPEGSTNSSKSKRRKQEI